MPAAWWISPVICARLAFDGRRHPQLFCSEGRLCGFTLTDGALRMLVLLHFFHLGYSPFVLSFLFLLYEAANFIGG